MDTIGDQAVVHSQSTRHRAGAVAITDGQSLRLFFVLACAISWTIQVPLAMQSQGLLGTSLPYGLHYLSAFGPLLSAFIVTYYIEGKSGIQSLWRRMWHTRVHPGWWFASIAPLIAFMLIAIALALSSGSPPGLFDLGQVDFLPNLRLLALPFWILTFGIGEETGWRFFALPYLQRGRSALLATFILWVFWTVWHFPLFFYSYDVAVLPGLVLGLLAGSITFTWLYNSTGGSVLILTIWHGTFNDVTACSLCKTGVSSAVVSALVMVWALLVVVRYRPARLSHAEKQIA